MKDFLGQELAVGDTVVFPEPRYRNLAKGKIVRFTPKKAVIEYTHTGFRLQTTYTIEPQQYIVKVENKNA